MLDEKRIKEAEKNVKAYLEDNLIWKLKQSKKEILDTYKRNCKESITLADKIFGDGLSNLWVIVISYYAMFYSANAVLYTIGYKVGSKVSHKVTADALVVLVRSKLKKGLLEGYEEAKGEALEIIGRRSDEIIESFEQELEKRSVFQYESIEEIKKAKAETSLIRAKRFIFEMSRLLEDSR